VISVPDKFSSESPWQVEIVEKGITRIVITLA
jgi:hypothetical protein